jgi:hypothetical protein
VKPRDGHGEGDIGGVDLPGFQEMLVGFKELRGLPIIVAQVIVGPIGIVPYFQDVLEGFAGGIVLPFQVVGRGL